MKRRTVRRSIARLAVAVCALVLGACAESPTQTPLVLDAQFAKGGNGPSINAADPAMAEQDVTLDVRVLGSGFDRGSSAKWLLQGAAAPEVTTNSTTYVSSTELVANITIDLVAATELYDIEVTTRRGKKGVGVELFAVEEKGNGSNQNPTLTVDLAGGMNTPQPQDAITGTETSKNNIEYYGLRPGECVTADDPDCFWTDIALGIDVDDGRGKTGVAACTLPRGMTQSYADYLFTALMDDAQARWSFEVNISTRHNDAFWRTFWFEDGNPNRFDLLHSIDSAVETPEGSGVWLMQGGGVEITHGNDGLSPLSCPWTGTITMTVRPGSP